MAWWRAYDEAVDDPKLQRLPSDLFKSWFNLVCLASRNGGFLPSLQDMAFSLRRSEKEVERIIAKLTEARLFDETADGVEPHNWNGRQYKSDVSTNRVKRFRKRRMERDETVSRNAPEQSRADSRAPPSGAHPEEQSKSSPVAAREDGPEGADAHDIKSIMSTIAARIRV